jgi:membrane protein implicated in regulation of membrane protease activity
MKDPTNTPRRINWLNVSTVISAAILIAAEVFGGAFAAGWAFALLFGLPEWAHWVLQAIFFALGMVVMAAFIRSAQRVEPFFTRG